MTAIFLAAFLAQPECCVSRQRALKLVRAADRASRRYSLPEGLLLAVVLVETGGRNVLVRGIGKSKAGCDVGPAQIHVPYCIPHQVAKMRITLPNLMKSAQILSWSRSRCSRYPRWTGCRCLWGRYNPGSRSWCRKVLRVWEKLLLYANI